MKKNKIFFIVIVGIFLLSFVFAKCGENQIDINSATLEELDKLTGIGETKAQAIIDFRSENYFYSIDDLIKVSGIGDATVKKIKEQNLACVVNETFTNNSQFEEIQIISEEKIPEIKVDYTKSVLLDEEFIFKIKLINFPDGKYDIKIEIFDDDVRVARILNNEIWKSTAFYIEDIIKNNEEKEFYLKIISDFEDARIEIKIKDSKEKVKIFDGYKISKEDSEENDNEGETDKKDGESSVKNESSEDKIAENIGLKPIVLMHKV